MESPSYYAIIPSDVRYDSNLSSSEKLLYAELTALCSKHGYCWASNNYFSELYGVNKNTISSWVSSLVKNGYIKIDVDRAKGNLRKIYLKKNIAIPKKMETYTEKAVDNNKKNNKKNNTTNNNDIDVIKIKNLWNKTFMGTFVPSISNVRNTRLRALSSRTREHPDIKFWEEYFNRIKSSDFLSGTSSDWRVNIDWVLSPSNMDKILEGNYDNRKEEKKKPTQEQIDKSNAFKQLEEKYKRGL